jgi:hypothetical protein
MFDPLLGALVANHIESAPIALRARLLPIPVGRVKTLSKAQSPRLRLAIKKRARSSAPFIPPEPMPARNPDARPLRAILEEVCWAHGFTLSEIRADCRIACVVAARQEFFFRAMSETTYSTPQIARAAGRTDHSTVLHAVAKYCDVRGLTVPRGASTHHFRRRQAKAAKLKQESMTGCSAEGGAG